MSFIKNKDYGQVLTILGAQWGDEGKGKLIDILSKEYDIIARAAGGANAGHTVYVPKADNPKENDKYVFHLMPSGMLYPNTIGVIGNGCVIHLPTLVEEINLLEDSGIKVSDRLFISDRAHLVFDYHKKIDGIQEESKGSSKVGTTKRGIGPAYMDKIGRSGIRVHDLQDFEMFEFKLRANASILSKTYNTDIDPTPEIDTHREILGIIKPLIKDTSLYLDNAIKEGKKILIEGANGTLLDIDHGTYPFVTSSNASMAGIIGGTGISPNKIDTVIGIMKAYSTRVGAGPFPTELSNSIGDDLRTAGGEFGATTGRPRRCGWFDAVAAKYSCRLNGYNSINLTKLDVLSDLDTIKIGVKYILKGKQIESLPASANDLEEVDVDYIELPGWKENISNVRKIEVLPKNALAYVKKIEQLIDCKISSVGVGISRDQMAF